MEIKQNLKQTQSLLMSQQVQQAIKILTLGRQELEEFIGEELRENPCLEELEGQGDADEGGFEQAGADSGPGGDDSGLAQLESEANRSLEGGDDSRGIDDLLARFSDLGASDSRDAGSVNVEEIDTPIYDRIRTENDSLHEELEEQLRMMHLTQYEFSCCMLLLQYLDDAGLVSTDIEGIAEAHDIPLDDMEYALSVLQRCEPTGVGARSLQECLLLQAHAHDDAPALVKRILSDHWAEFEKQDVNKIVRLTKARIDDVKRAIVFIREELDPRPARQFGGGTNQVVTPDVFIFKREDEWLVSLNEDGLPRLRVSKKYSDLVAGLGQTRKGVDPEHRLKEFVNDRIKSARWIVRAIAERNKTILRVTEVILTRQREFFEKGIESLKPLTLRMVADELGLHESTISRTTTSKYVHTPRGLYELKYFFNAGMSSSDGSELANEAVKNWVAEYIRGEDSKKPLSDQEIATLIEKEKSLKVARRTVAKYREGLGLLSSSKRGRKF